MYSRGVRGAITVEEDTPELIEKATVELYSKMIEANDIKTEDISHIILGIDKSLDSEIIVDYVNGNPRDNRRINLKICTHSQNHLSNNSTGIIGVSYDKNRHVYAPEIRIGKKRVHLGRYRSIEEAAYVRLVAEKYLFKEFTNDNDDIRKKENMSTTISQVRQDELYDYTISKIQAHFGN